MQSPYCESAFQHSEEMCPIIEQANQRRLEFLLNPAALGGIPLNRLGCVPCPWPFVPCLCPWNIPNEPSLLFIAMLR